MSTPICPQEDCDETLSFGALLDCVTGQRGWSCDSCKIGYTSWELKRHGVLEE